MSHILYLHADCSQFEQSDERQVGQAVKWKAIQAGNALVAADTNDRQPQRSCDGCVWKILNPNDDHYRKASYEGHEQMVHGVDF